MGFIKNSLISFLNKRHFYLIKTYAYYRKDIWGLIRVKRLYKYKKIIYSILKRKKKYYGLMLFRVYKGIKFFNKEYNYRSNLFFTKKRLKLFYGNLRDSYFGKLGLLVKNKTGILINYFYSLLERRVDVLIYRALYSLTVRFSQKYINKKNVFINSKLVYFPGTILYLGDFLRLRFRTFSNPFFFRYHTSNALETFKHRYALFYGIKETFINWMFFEEFSKQLLPLFMNLNYNYFSFKNKKKIVLRFIYKLPFVIYTYIIYIIKKWQRLIKFKKKNPLLKFKKKKFLLFKKLYIYIIIKFSLIILHLKYHDKSITFFYRRFFRLYGLINLRIRFKKFFYFLRPKWYNRVFSYINTKRRLKIIKKKKYRYWRLTHASYLLFKKTNLFFFFYKGYLSHLEINYKAHLLLLSYSPKINSITFPFGVNKWIFFDYFRRKAYF